MEDTKTQDERGRPTGDAAFEFGVVRVFSKPAPDADDRLRRLFTILLKPPAGDGQAESQKDAPPDGRHVDDHLEAEGLMPSEMPSNQNQLSLRRSALSEDASYQAIFGDVSKIIDAARDRAARSVNAAMTAAYWQIGRRIVEFEQAGEERAEYGDALIERLAEDLTGRFGRGFSLQGIYKMRLFYLSFPPARILPTLSGKFKTASDGVGFDDLLTAFPLPWSAYVRLLSVRNEQARSFYETEALRGGWSVRQLDRQIGSQFYERTTLSKNKAAMLTEGRKPKAEDLVRPEEEIKDPFVLEFLDLKDEYSESDLEDALIRHLETFLMELGGDFCFMGRQRRLRIGNRWYRVDLLFYHRGLRCLVVIDLKIGAFTHADAGQMHLYLNYAREHWVREGENPPVGLILCSEKDEALARYALDGLSNNVMAGEYRITLPDEELLAGELDRTRQAMELRGVRSANDREE